MLDTLRAYGGGYESTNFESLPAILQEVIENENFSIKFRMCAKIGDKIFAAIDDIDIKHPFYKNTLRG